MGSDVRVCSGCNYKWYLYVIIVVQQQVVWLYVPVDDVLRMHCDIGSVCIGEVKGHDSLSYMYIITMIIYMIYDVTLMMSLLPFLHQRRYTALTFSSLPHCFL